MKTIKETIAIVGKALKGAGKAVYDGSVSVGKTAYRKFSIKDPIGIGGFIMFWYGLHLYSEPLSYTVCGPLLVIFSFLLREK
jgi:hypothetical protein